MAAAGPLQERTLNIADELIEPFLVNDPVKVFHAYVRELAPQIELARRFGDRHMTDAFSRVAEQYAVLKNQIRAAGGGDVSKRLTKLEQQEESTLRAIERVRDRVLGIRGRMDPTASDTQRRLVEFNRGWRNWVSAAKLGGTALTGGASDLSRIMATHGFTPTMRKLIQLATSPAFRKLSKANARRLGAAVEVTLANRAHVAFDSAVTAGWTQKLANGVYRASGLNHLTDFYRTLTTTLLEDQVLRTASNVVSGRGISKAARTRLASLGLDEDALRAIHAEVQAHGATVDGIRTSGSMQWRDGGLAERYDAAVLKEARTLVMQPGAADRVAWMDSEMGRLLGQLKSFSLASPVRSTVHAVQMAGMGHYGHAVRFLGFMMTGGYLAHAARQLSAGKKPQTDPVYAAGEALSESAMLGILPDLLAPVGRRFGVLGESARFSDSNIASVFGGPAVGAGQDALEWVMTRSRGGISASDVQMLRRLLPYQNLFYARRLINALQGEAAESMDLKGADHATFRERMLRTDPLAPSSQRGTTGTGVGL